MAIQLDLQSSQYGVPFAGAYFRVVTAMLQRQPLNPQFVVMIDVAGYAAQPQTDDTKDIDFRRYYAPFSEVEAQTGDNFLAKCYAWVMTQPDMVGSIGV
jgi:hypothetical protein